jgi:hypothetical protein
MGFRQGPGRVRDKGTLDWIVSFILLAKVIGTNPPGATTLNGLIANEKHLNIGRAYALLTSQTPSPTTPLNNYEGGAS